MLLYTTVMIEPDDGRESKVSAYIIHMQYLNILNFRWIVLCMSTAVTLTFWSESAQETIVRMERLYTTDNSERQINVNVNSGFV